MKDDNLTIYNKEDVFEKEIKAKLDEVIALCNFNRIPFFYSACVANSENGAEYKSDSIGAAEKEIFLDEDKIAKHIAVCAGFDVIPHRRDLDKMILDDDDYVLDDRMFAEKEDDSES